MGLGAEFRQPFGYRLQDHFGQFAIVKATREKVGVAADVYVDLPSERPRVGVVEGELQLKQGQRCRVIPAERSGMGDEVPVPALGRFLPDIGAGHRILIRDGHTVLRVMSCTAEAAETEVERSIEGVATNNNIMFPDSAVRFEPVTDADRELLGRYREAGFAPEWVMLSLVTSTEQVERARAELGEIFGDARPKVMVKIETAKSVERMRELLGVADGLLVGRGDLGMTVAPETIPAIQEDVVRECRRAGKRVLVATEFLQRFAETGVPNRAELSDVALAVRQGVHGIVLTKETSGSPYALEAVRLAKSVIEIERRRMAGARD
jgi:pyruvate kinase